MCFIKEEDQLRLREVSDLRKGLEEFGQHPEKECRIETAVVDQALAVEYADHSFAALSLSDPVCDLECRLAEEDVPALGFKSDDCPQDGPDGVLRDVAVRIGEFSVILTDIIQHGLQILRINEEELVVIRDLEYDGQEICLKIVEIQNSREKGRPHLGNRRAELNSVLPKQIIVGRRISRVGKACVTETESCDAGIHILALFSGKCRSCKVSLDICHKDRHTQVAERFSHDLQSDRLSGTGRACDQSVTVRHGGKQIRSLPLVCESHPNFAF